jgi:superfamily II DNA or RNA helicase
MLVVVNTVDLLQQWTKTINKFLPDVKVGKIQGEIFDTQDKQIVIGMLQTISLKDNLSQELFKDFGITVYDEVHLISAEKFSKALIKTRSRYVFGLSATIERKDGMEIVFKYHIGDIIFSNSSNSKKQNTIIKTIYNTNPNSKELRIYSGNPNISAMITELSEDIARTNVICKEILNLKKDRNILVLSERVAHLKIMHEILGDESALFIGGMKENDKTISKGKRILLATYHIASVGFDHPKLNTLVFATPRSNITQAIGRIYRKEHEITPMIIDIVDTYSVFPYQYKKRKTIYKNSIESQVEPEVECLFD